jgi:ubiquinone/menaquinone biosynthesis C-methylase UbiE
MNAKAHWETVYETKPSDTVSWYEATPTRSMALLDEAGLNTTSAVLDVGGGDSMLVSALVARGVQHVSVLDLSGAALRRAQARLGDAAAAVTWIEGDITTVELPAAGYDFWHDRAVFHFLTTEADRANYVATASRAIRAGGTLIIATFALDGPPRCSGLDVARYSPEQLAAVFRPAFAPVQTSAFVHHTPGGAEQRFSVAVLVRT